VFAATIHEGEQRSVRASLRRSSIVCFYCLAVTHASAQAPPPGPVEARAPWSTPALAHVPSPSWLALSGEARIRVESRDGLGYRPGTSDTYLLVRTRLHLDVRPHALVGLSFQGQDARASGILSPSATGVFRDPFDLRQANLRLGRAAGDAPLALTVGRQALSYGNQRMIGALDRTNTSRAFDAAKVELRTARFDLDFHTFALASARDHLYDAPGAISVQVPTGGADARRVGEELDFSFAMPVGQTLALSGGIGRFFPGPFVEANSGGASHTFAYTALAVRVQRRCRAGSRGGEAPATPLQRGAARRFGAMMEDSADDRVGAEEPVERDVGQWERRYSRTTRSGCRCCEWRVCV
jgi:hypothetical protein